MSVIQFPCNVGKVFSPSNFDVPVSSEFCYIGFRGSEVRNEYEWSKQGDTCLIYLLLLFLSSNPATDLGEPVGVGLSVKSEG